MADGFIHTVWKDGEWQNEVEGGDRVPGDFSTKEEAVAIGRARALADETDMSFITRTARSANATRTATILCTAPANPGSPVVSLSVGSLYRSRPAR